MLDAAEDDQLRLVHVILIATAKPRATLAAVASELGRSHGELRGLTLKPVGARFDAVLRLTGIDEEAAERLAAAIAAWPNAGSVSVEHQALRP